MLTYPVTFAGTFSVDFSCDFPGTDDYLSRIHTLNDRTEWTFSFWAERDVTAALEYILSTHIVGGSNPDAGVIFPSTDTFALYDWDGATYDIRESGGDSTTAGWNHWMANVDTDQASTSIRVVLRKNGSIISATEFDVRPSTGFNTRIGGGTTHNIGRLSEDGTGDFNGRLAEVCMVDGQNLGPTVFRSSGGLPIEPRVGDWGSGGFWLRFLDPGALGKDYSGNGNDWTVNGGLTQSTDTP